jgi:hypothetical protein
MKKIKGKKDTKLKNKIFKLHNIIWFSRFV